MAEHDENSLIGYDPLAWMHQAESHQDEFADSLEEFAPLIDEAVEDCVEETGSAMRIDEVDQLTNNPVNSGEAKGHWVLDAVLNIQNVATLHRRLTQMLDDFDAIDIDASAVNVVDTATLQLLLILKQTALRTQKTITIDFPSDKFIEAAGLLGLAEMLEVDQAASGFF